VKTAIMILAATLLAGCLLPGPQVGYIADRDIHVAGWDCPKADDQSHWITFFSPPCSWLPGGLFFKSCTDHYVANVEKSRGCTQQATASTTTVTP
jgi:hypothetical protein